MLVAKVSAGLVCYTAIFLAQIFPGVSVASAYSVDWGPWTEWSGCSDSCDNLLASRNRSCAPSKSTPNVCQGVHKQYKLCNYTQCRKESYDPRQEECDRQMHIPFRGRRYHWKPYNDKEKPCEVTCKSTHYGFSIGFGRPLQDGTDCSEVQDTGICLHGKCQAVGCDGVVGSGLRNDHCGVCGGDNESCRIIAGIFTRRTLDYGYNQITRIPAGSCHINITELERSRNYLVLKYADGTGVINSDRSMMKRPGQYLAAGTMFSYGKQAGSNCPGECLYGQGPITADMDIQLLTYRENPGIKYMFTIPKDKIDSVFKSLSPSTDSLTRHEGHHHGNSQGSHVSSINSNSDVDTGRRLSYNVQPEYVSPEYEKGSSSGYQALESGSHGTQEAINRYRQGFGPQNEESFRNNINDNTNFHQRNTLPSDTRSNNLPVDSRYHVTSRERPNPSREQPFPSREQLNQIPQTDFQEQVLTPGIDSYGSGRTGVRYPQYGNDPQRQSQLYVPDTIDEVNFRWAISGFTECSTSCGGGRQDTIVVCMKRNTNIVVTDENCDPAKKNIQTIICNKSPCPPDWEAGPWSVCSRTCGEGLQTRKVECQQRYSQNDSVPITASLCNLVAKPATSQQCEVKPCAQWNTGNWTKCSVECGIGQVSRSVDCVNTQDEVVPDQECRETKPVGLKSCDMGTCAQGWFLTGWSKECSNECGRGYRFREAYCSAEDGSPLPESKCGSKPRTKRACKKNRPCGGLWFEGPWSTCSATCGSSVQTRDVVCMKKLEKGMFAVVKEENCKGRPKPETQKPCPALPECPAEWYMTKWSQCSKTCGAGLKTRDVKCLDTQKSPNAQCGKGDKPSLRRTCNTQDCNLPQLDEDPECKDTMTQCRFVVQAALCPYEFYKNQCCHSCTLHHLKHKQQREQQQQQEASQQQQHLEQIVQDS